MERLCFGTFINVLAQCKNVGIPKGRLTNTVVKTIDPKSKYYITEDERKSGYKGEPANRALNYLYKCNGDFSPQYSCVRELALKADREAVIRQFEENVIPLIDLDKAKQAVLALYDIIKKDTTLKADDGVNVLKFQKCAGGKTIQSFLNDTQYDMSEILASIFLYTVTAVKNDAGKKWLTKITEECKDMNKSYKSFFEEYVNSFRLLALSTAPVADVNKSEQAYDPPPIAGVPSLETLPRNVSASDTGADYVSAVPSSCDSEPVYTFFYSYNKFAVADFIKHDPIDLILTLDEDRPNKLIDDAQHFVEYMESIIENTTISKENEHICEDIKKLYS